jgi:hypothetical protein
MQFERLPLRDESDEYMKTMQLCGGATVLSAKLHFFAPATERMSRPQA